MDTREYCEKCITESLSCLPIFKESHDQLFAQTNLSLVTTDLDKRQTTNYEFNLQSDDSNIASNINSSQLYTCSIGGCKKTFTDVLRFESHYNTAHRNVCSQCKKVLPTSHLLELHIQENHDSHFAVLSEIKPMYQCLVESCEVVFKDPQRRKDHLIKEHRYPTNYRFSLWETKHSVQQKVDTSQNVSRIESPDKHDVKDESMITQPAQTENIAPRRFSYKVPQNISFGSGVARGFKSARGRGSRHRSKMSDRTSETMDFSEMSAVLDQ